MTNILEQSLECVRIIDDDPAVREVLDRLLVGAGFVTRVFESAEIFISSDTISQPGCVLVDLMLPGLGGADFMDWMHRQNTPLPTIILTGFGTVPAAVECLKRGAFDFLEKPFDSEGLVATVRRAMETSHMQRRSKEAADEVRQRFGALSARERQVLGAIYDGMLSKQIAGQLSLSERTVEKHRSSVMKKMNADSLASLVRMVVEAGLLPLSAARRVLATPGGADEDRSQTNPAECQ